MKLHRLPPARRLVVTPVLVAGLALFTACGEDSAGPEQGADVEDVTGQEALDEETTTTTVPEAGIDEDERGIFENTESFVGEQVTVSAQVTSTVSPNGFRLSGQDFGGEPLLVVHGGQASASEDAVVRVTGTVREFNLTEVESELGVDLQDETFAGFGGEHVIVANNVEILQPDPES